MTRLVIPTTVAALFVASCGPPPAPPTPSTRTDDFPIVDAAALGPRISGEIVVAPRDRIKDQIRQSCRDRLAVQSKLCVGVDGVPTSAAVTGLSGIPEYDAQVQDAVMEWRYQPQQTPVCTLVVFAYTQKNRVISSHCTGIHPD